MRSLRWLCGAVCLIASSVMAQDPVKVDPKHYKVEFENAQVRVLRIHYGPGEKSVTHAHPNSVAVFLKDMHSKFDLADGPFRAARNLPEISENGRSRDRASRVNSTHGADGGLRGTPSLPYDASGPPVLGHSRVKESLPVN